MRKFWIITVPATAVRREKEMRECLAYFLSLDGPVCWFMEFFAKCWPVMLIARDDCFLCIAAKKGQSLLKICMNFFGPKLFCLQLLTYSYKINLSGSACIDYFYS
jgi:hypothetical protein